MANLISQYLTNDFKFNSYTEMNDTLLYIDYMSRKKGYSEVAVEPHLAYKYQGDFYGLLNKLNVSKNLYLYTLYLNGYTDPNDFDGNRYLIKVPNEPNIPRS